MKKLSHPQNIGEAVTVLAVFGLFGLASLVGYKLLKEIKKPKGKDIDYEDLHNHR